MSNLKNEPFCWPHERFLDAVGLEANQLILPIDKRQRECLLVLLGAGALDVNSLMSADEIAHAAGGRGTPKGRDKNVLIALKLRRLLCAKGGSRGGYWLTEDGYRIAQGFSPHQ